MSYKAFFTAVAVLICAGASAQGEVDDTSPVFRSHGTTVFMHSSMTKISLTVGDNAIWKPRTFICKSAKGCIVVTVASFQQADNGGNMICSYVDGVAGAPGCLHYGIAISVNQQQISVAQGPHTITTVVNALSPGSSVIGWALQYSIYERGHI